jgi:hypothetical protein
VVRDKRIGTRQRSTERVAGESGNVSGNRLSTQLGLGGLAVFLSGGDHHHAQGHEGDDLRYLEEDVPVVTR